MYPSFFRLTLLLIDFKILVRLRQISNERVISIPTAVAKMSNLVEVTMIEVMKMMKYQMFYSLISRQTHCKIQLSTVNFI